MQIINVNQMDATAISKAIKEANHSMVVTANGWTVKVTIPYTRVCIDLIKNGVEIGRAHTAKSALALYNKNR